MKQAEISETEMADGLFELQRYCGVSRDFAFCLDPAATTKFHRYAMQPWPNRQPGMTMGPLPTTLALAGSAAALDCAWAAPGLSACASAATQLPTSRKAASLGRIVFISNLAFEIRATVRPPGTA